MCKLVLFTLEDLKEQSYTKENSRNSCKSDGCFDGGILTPSLLLHFTVAAIHSVLKVKKRKPANGPGVLFNFRRVDAVKLR